MLIQSGIKRKGKIKAQDFHKAFGSVTTPVADFSLDTALRPVPDQNNPDTIFNTPAQPQGCTGEATSQVMQDWRKILYSPWYSYQQTCIAEGVPVGSPCQMTYALNEPVTSGLLALGETQPSYKSHQWYEVTPLNGSLFQGLISAMSVGKAPISFAGMWYESWETPDANGVVPTASGDTSEHDWEYCGVKTINGVQTIAAKPWLGPNIADKGTFYFPQSVVDAMTGCQAFTPQESPSASTPAPVSTYTLIQSLINFIVALLTGTGNKVGGTVFTNTFSELEEEIESISNQIPTMEENVYNIAKASLGKHMTLNEAVPAETGCAECVSKILALAGISDGSGGISGTASLYQWLLNNTAQFTRINAPEAGAIIISPTGFGNNLIEGHTGFFGEFNTAFPNDFGILSNDSATGLLLETWSWTRWQAYYGVAGGLPLAIFRPV